jgi:hypothetical protein
MLCHATRHGWLWTGGNLCASNKSSAHAAVREAGSQNVCMCVQLRSVQQEETKSIAAERLALVALAANVATDEAATKQRERSSSRFAAVDPSDSSVGATAAVSLLKSAMAMPTAVGVQRSVVVEESQSRVFGPSLPGLVICEAGNRVYHVYASMRNHFVSDMAQRLATDVCMAALLLSAVALAN